MPLLLHILARTDWEAAQQQGRYEAASLRTEGFIHFSRPHQLLRTAERFYQGRTDLLVLQVQQDALHAPLKDDPADGDLFPHLYGPLNLDAVVGVIELRWMGDRFELPAGVVLDAER